MKTQQKNKRRGFSLVELMVGLTIFIVVVLAVAGSQQKISKNLTKDRLSERTLEYLSAEVDRLKRMARIPERDQFNELIYRDENGSIVQIGGELIPFGYNDLLKESSLNPSGSNIVTYPDVLLNQLTDMSEISRVTLKREFSIQEINVGELDEHKKVTITLSDSENPPRFRSLVREMMIKKPHPLALDTRVANGFANFSGTILEKNTSNVISPAGSVVVTLTPNDGTSPRYATADGSGLFYYPPPLKTEILYDIKFEYADQYWTRIIEDIQLTPGVNKIDGDLNDIVFLSPRVYAEAHFSVRDADTNQPIEGASVDIRHSGTVPNGRPSYYINYIDSSGITDFTIEIPKPDIETYGKYYLYRIRKTNYVEVNRPSDKWLSLDKNQGLTRSYVLHKAKLGKLEVIVTDSEGHKTEKAYVEVYRNANYTGRVYYGKTDSNGAILFENIWTNIISAPTQTIRRFYVKVRAANHLKYLTFKDVVADQTTTLEATLEPHVLKWDDEDEDELNMSLGHSRVLITKLWYEGVEGPAINDATIGPNPRSFLSESIVSGGFPGTFNWTDYDPDIISVSDHPQLADRKTVVCLALGQTSITVDSVYSYNWSGQDYSLNKSRSYNVQCSNNDSPLSVNLTPIVIRMNPGTQKIFEAIPSQQIFDIHYTWSVSGGGAQQIEILDGVGNSATNGGLESIRCRITAVNSFPEFYTIGITINSSSTEQVASDQQTVAVDYAPLSASIIPTGPILMNPGDHISLNAFGQGGSGQYTYLWSLLDPYTGNPDQSDVGSLSSTTSNSTEFSAHQIGSVSANVTITDVNTGEYRDAAILINNVAPGGVSQ